MGGFLPGGGFPSLPGGPGLPGISPLPGGGGINLNPFQPVPDTGHNQSGPVTIGAGNIPGIDIELPFPGGGSGAGNIKLTTGTLISSASSFLSSPVGYLFGSSLLRLAFFILGFICIIGAIYLYKDTRFIIKAPVNAATGAIRDAVAA